MGLASVYQGSASQLLSQYSGETEALDVKAADADSNRRAQKQAVRVPASQRGAPNAGEFRHKRTREPGGQEVAHSYYPASIPGTVCLNGALMKLPALKIKKKREKNMCNLSQKEGRSVCCCC